MAPKKKKKKKIRPGHFRKLFAEFTAPVCQIDCGQKCAPLNGGSPLCCSTDNAIPIMDRAEWHLLRHRTDIWSRFIPFDDDSQEIVDELANTCVAVECKGAQFCERDNRSLSCRTFPFFPYITEEGEFIGLSYYWDFEDTCWVLSNLKVVEQDYIEQFVAAYEMRFAEDPDEFPVFQEHSADMRKAFAKDKRPFPVISRHGGFLKVLPGGGMEAAEVSEFPAHGAYVSDEAFRKAVEEAEAEEEEEEEGDEAYEDDGPDSPDSNEKSSAVNAAE